MKQKENVTTNALGTDAIMRCPRPRLNRIYRTVVIPGLIGHKRSRYFHLPATVAIVIAGDKTPDPAYLCDINHE